MMMMMMNLQQQQHLHPQQASSSHDTNYNNNNNNEIKTQLITREGVYRLITNAEYGRPKISPYMPHHHQSATNGPNGQNSSNLPLVRISFTKFVTNNHLNNMIGSPTTFPQSFRNDHSDNNAINNHENQNGHLSNSDDDDDNNKEMIIQNNNNNNFNQNIFHYTHHTNHHHQIHIQERICFNSGRELFLFGFHGLQPSDPNDLIDRKTYKATSPTCHDFCTYTEPIPISLLLIGFSLGQIQLIDFYRTEISKFFNQERLIDKSKVTCIRWLPRSKSIFLVSYSSGHMYVYKEDLSCFTTTPNYQQFKCGDGFAVHTCKTRQPRNPIFRWSIGAASSINASNNNNHSNLIGGNMFSHQSAINEFSFSPCGKYLAVVSQDGFLRVFHYDQMDLIGRMRSYFGGLLCVAWSPDSKFIVTGGEDDLITVWSLQDKRVVARGQGHKSWVNCVQFDAYMTDYTKNDVEEERDEDDAEDEDSSDSRNAKARHSVQTISSAAFRSFTNYRIGSVGQDTQICLWDLTDDIIRQSTVIKSRSRSTISCGLGGGSSSHQTSSSPTQLSTPVSSNTSASTVSSGNESTPAATTNKSFRLFGSSSSNNHNSNFFNSLKKGVHKKTMVGFSLGGSKSASKSDNSKNSSTTDCNNTSAISHSHSHNNHSNTAIDINHCDSSRLLGTVICPRLKEIPMLEPHICKKISNERLTSLIFRQDSIVIANHDGKILIFARPNRSNHSNVKISSPNASMASDVNEIPIVPGDE